MTRIEYFRKFGAISHEDHEILCAALKPKSFRKGEVLVVPGQVQRELYFVENGIQMAHYETDHKTHVIAFTYFPDLCAIPGSFSLQKPSNCFLTCLTDSELNAISYDHLKELFDASHALERLFRKMTEYLLAGVINRHIELHASTIESRFTAFCRRSPHLLNMVPHKYIASYLGIDPSNFSKLYNSVKI